MKKVEMVELKSLCSSEYDRIHYPEGAIVTVINSSNETIQRFNGAATGMPVKPMSDKLLSNKFMSCAETQSTRKQAIEVLERLKSIETATSINDLFGLDDTI